jgi:hypothetical protein
MSLLSTCLGGSSRRLLKAIILTIIVVPLISVAQVRIKEKVEIKTKALVPTKRLSGSIDFFSPPLFFDDEGTLVVPLASTLIASGSINVKGQIDQGCWAQVGYSMYDGHALAWRDYSEGGGEPLTVSLEYGEYMPVIADIKLRLHNAEDWPGVSNVGTRTMTITEERISYEFMGQLHNFYDDSWTDVQGSASLVGHFEPGVLFGGWSCIADPIICRGRDSTWLSITPLNSSGTPYSPVDISSDGVQINVSIDAQGEYVFLSTVQLDQDGRPIEGTYVTGKQLTVPLSSDIFLVYDESKGTFDGTTETVQVTVSGGGASSSSSVKLLKYDLLLGESRYYYVAANSSGGGVPGGARGKNTRSLAKVNSSYMIMPDGDPLHLPPDWETNVDWNVSPVVTDDTLGVYYETHHEGGNVPQGMIRLVGRYWREGNSHPVRSEANWAEVQVNVNKPAKLINWKIVKGEPDFVNGNDYSQTTDVLGSPLNVDNLIIDFAGRYGIPPQYIKGHMYKEADKSAVRGRAQFNPSYRYEPWADYEFQKRYSKVDKWGNRANSYLDQPFVVAQGSMGLGHGVPSHRGVLPIGYEINPIHIGEYTVREWPKYFDNSTETFIGKTPADPMNVWWKKLKAYYMSKFNDDEENAKVEATKTVQSAIITYRPQWAQTRKSASYGIIQLTYEEANTKGYQDGKPKNNFDEWNIPEDLNYHVIAMPFYVKVILAKLQLQFGSSVPDSEWNKGFETTWEETLDLYNVYEDNYGQAVISNSRKFLPQSH